MAIDLAPELLDILACPNCHGSLAVDHDRDELVCLAADCGLAYPVRDGIPVLLIDEARRPGPDLPSGSAASAASAADPSTSASAADPSSLLERRGSGASASAADPGTAASAAGVPGSSSSAAVPAATVPPRDRPPVPSATDTERP